MQKVLINSDQHLIESFWLPQTLEDFTLTLAVLLCHERLLLYAINNIAQPIKSSYLAGLDAS